MKTKFGHGTARAKKGGGETLRIDLRGVDPCDGHSSSRPFGVGAMNDFRNDEALMCAGLDRWFSEPARPCANH